MADVIAHSPLTEAELTVLAHLDDAGGSVRQNALAAATGWDRTRLSHLLTRMHARGWVAREKLRNGVQVTMLDEGRGALSATRAPLATAVETHVMSRLDAAQQQHLRDVIDALTD